MMAEEEEVIEIEEDEAPPRKRKRGPEKEAPLGKRGDPVKKAPPRKRKRGAEKEAPLGKKKRDTEDEPPRHVRVVGIDVGVVNIGIGVWDTREAAEKGDAYFPTCGHDDLFCDSDGTLYTSWSAWPTDGHYMVAHWLRRHWELFKGADLALIETQIAGTIRDGDGGKGEAAPARKHQRVSSRMLGCHDVERMLCAILLTHPDLPPPMRIGPDGWKKKLGIPTGGSHARCKRLANAKGEEIFGKERWAALPSTDAGEAALIAMYGAKHFDELVRTRVGKRAIGARLSGGGDKRVEVRRRAKPRENMQLGAKVDITRPIPQELPHETIKRHRKREARM